MCQAISGQSEALAAVAASHSGLLLFIVRISLHCSKRLCCRTAECTCVVCGRLYRSSCTDASLWDNSCPWR